MDKHLLNCLDLVDDATMKAVTDRKLSGGPFASQANEAHALFAGFRVIAEILEVDLLRGGIDCEEHRRLTDGQKGALFSLIRTASWLMERQGCEIVEWAGDCLDAMEGAGHD